MKSEKQSAKHKTQRYRHVAGKPWIEVRVKDPQQLFDVRDPAPFRERDLDDDFVKYIVSSAQEFSISTPIKIAIYIEAKEATNLEQSAIQEAIHSYFLYQTELQAHDLKRFAKRAQLFLFIGVLVLISCLSIAQNLPVMTPPGPIGILREGIIIFGWVSIWKPIELLMFDWYPIYEGLRLYKKLVATEFIVQFSK
jgi:hypothetical protein